MSLLKPQEQVTILKRIQNENSALLFSMKASAKRVFDLLWRSKDKTPQEVCDEMGSDAAKGFEAHGKLQELIYLIDPTWVPLMPPNVWVKNDDGTVKIGAAV